MTFPDTLASCHVLIGQLSAITERQQRQIEDLTAKVTDLETRLKGNGGNSHRPPSSDGLSRKPGIPKAGKDRGGQKGHGGKTLMQTDAPDRTVRLTTPLCPCGVLLDPESGEAVKTCQVFDLPQPKLEVTEYQVIRQVCVCGRVHLGELPAGVAAPAQYGAGVQALTVLLNNSCQMSYQKVGVLFSDLFGFELNEGTAVSNNAAMYGRLENAENQVKKALAEAPLVHFDETGVRVSDKLRWLHTACSERFTHLFVSEKRGKNAHQPNVSVLPRFKGWAVHDSYATYFTYPGCRHALCGAHLLRECQGQVEAGKAWARPMKDFLLDLYYRSEKGTKTVSSVEEEKQKWLQMCQNAIQTEELTLPKADSATGGAKKKRGKKPRGKTLSLLDRLLARRDAVLAFAEYEIVPFTNNQAERDVRPVKTKQKVAGCFRTVDGANRYARIQGFISTCRKHHINVFKELKAALNPANLYVAPFRC